MSVHHLHFSGGRCQLHEGEEEIKMQQNEVYGLTAGKTQDDDHTYERVQ